MFANTADAGGLHGVLPHLPAARHAPGSRRELYDRDTGRRLGDIDEAPETYNVIGNLNEHGVAIGETKFGGNASLAGGEGIMDYSNLIWVTLQRTTTAFQAVQMFGSLTEKYGYISPGVSFTIADPGEAWILEMVGKGKFGTGAIWVAVRIPEGHISGHANQARIQHFPMNSPMDCVYSKDVISFAEKVGLWDASRPREQFSFAEVYDPINVASANRGDARIWAFFAVVSGDPFIAEAYTRFARGSSFDERARLPLSIQAGSKISVLDLMKHMRNHYNGTSLYQDDDVPAIGMLPAESGSRSKNWQFGNASVVHSRSTGTQEGGWNFVAQLRGHFPSPIGGLLWFGVDDATFTVHIPLHGGTTRVPSAFTSGDDTYWAFNAAAQFINPRWSVAPAVLEQAHSMEESYAEALINEEWKAWQLYKAEPAKAVELLTQQEEARARNATKAEIALLHSMMQRFQRGSSLRGADSPSSDGTREADLREAGKADLSAEDLDELKSWFTKMARQVQTVDDHYGFESLWARQGDISGPLRSMGLFSKVGALALSVAIVSMVVVAVLARYRPRPAQSGAVGAEALWVAVDSEEAVE